MTSSPIWNMDLNYNYHYKEKRIKAICLVEIVIKERAYSLKNKKIF